MNISNRTNSATNVRMHHGDTLCPPVTRVLMRATHHAVTDARACRHLSDGDEATLCALHPRGGLMCPTCATGHLWDHQQPVCAEPAGASGCRRIVEPLAVNAWAVRDDRPLLVVDRLQVSVVALACDQCCGQRSATPVEVRA